MEIYDKEIYTQLTVANDHIVNTNITHLFNLVHTT